MADWAGKRVVVIGLARQGKALARYLTAQGAHVTVSDQKPAASLASAIDELEGLPVEFVLGGHPPTLLEGADLLCLSGGVPADLPLAQQARAAGIGLTNDAQVFLEVCPGATIGITGSAGKTTTTALVGRMAEQHASRGAGRAWVGGNIGRPLLADLPKIRPEDWVVLELSSFQLELMTAGVHVAAMLNLTPNHLDRHHSMQAYTEAKARILDCQTAADKAVLGREDAGAWGLRHRVRGEVLAFGRQDHGLEGTFVAGDQVVMRRQGAVVPLLPLSDIRLRGEHNLLNVLAASTIALAAGLPVEALKEGVQGFKGVPHRLEFIRNWGGAAWYNDSIATAPERTIAAIRSFDEPLVLLVGGRDKDLPWDDFARLAHQRVDHLVVFGEAAGKIIEALEAVRAAGPTIARCPGLRQAVATASKIVRPGDVVLLSPGGTSFDEFNDFEERGLCFTQLVTQL